MAAGPGEKETSVNSPLSDLWLIKIFSHSVGGSFVLLMVFFALQKVFSFRRVLVLIFDPSVCAVGIIFSN